MRFAVIGSAAVPDWSLGEVIAPVVAVRSARMAGEPLEPPLMERDDPVVVTAGAQDHRLAVVKADPNLPPIRRRNRST